MLIYDLLHIFLKVSVSIEEPTSAVMLCRQFYLSTIFKLQTECSGIAGLSAIMSSFNM